MTSIAQPTVLVVDDEADLRQLIAESLTQDGFAVAQAADAAQAQERLKAFAYDALVVDLRLPDADGMDVLDAALSRYPDILAVMVTGFGGVTEAVSAINDDGVAQIKFLSRKRWVRGVRLPSRSVRHLLSLDDFATKAHLRQLQTQ